MKNFIAPFLIFFCINLYAQKGKLYQDHWYNEGKDSNGDFTLFEKGKLSYSLSNDNDVICVDIKVDDPGVQNRILKEGMTIWIDMGTKLAKTIGVRFPIGSQHSGGRNSALNMPAIKPDGTPITPLMQANTIELIGFTDEDQKRFPADNPDTFRGYVKYDNEGTLHYRMIIPVAKLPVRNAKDSKGPMPFNFGIEYGTEAQVNENRGQGYTPSFSGASRGGSGGGGSRGGGGGGGSRGGGSDMGGGPSRTAGASQNTVPSVICWIKNIKLATNQ